MNNIRYLFLTMATLLSMAFSYAQRLDYLIVPGHSFSSIGSFSGSLSRVELDFGKVGFIDTSGKRAFPGDFEDAGSFHCGRTWVAKSINGETRYGYIDVSGKLLIPYQYEQVEDFCCNRAAVKKNGSWQYIDRAGKVIIQDSRIMSTRPVQTLQHTTEMEAFDPPGFSQGLVVYRDKSNKLGYLDTTGRVAIPAAYFCAKDFSGNVALVAFNELSDSEKAKEDSISQVMDIPRGRDSYTWRLIDLKGKIVSTLDSVAEVNEFSNGYTIFTNEDDMEGLWGIIDNKGKIVISPRFQRTPSVFSDAVSWVQVDGVQDNNKDGYMLTFDTTGKEIARVPFMTSFGPMYDSNLGFHEGLLAVKINDKWGYMDKKGNMIIVPQFETALNFQEGLAVIKTPEGQVGVIRNPVMDAQNKKSSLSTKCIN